VGNNKLIFLGIIVPISLFDLSLRKMLHSAPAPHQARRAAGQQGSIHDDEQKGLRDADESVAAERVMVDHHADHAARQRASRGAAFGRRSI